MDEWLVGNQPEHLPLDDYFVYGEFIFKNKKKNKKKIIKMKFVEKLGKKYREFNFIYILILKIHEKIELEKNYFS